MKAQLCHLFAQAASSLPTLLCGLLLSTAAHAQPAVSGGNDLAAQVAAHQHQAAALMSAHQQQAAQIQAQHSAAMGQVGGSVNTPSPVHGATQGLPVAGQTAAQMALQMQQKALQLQQEQMGNTQNLHEAAKAHMQQALQQQKAVAQTLGGEFAKAQSQNSQIASQIANNLALSGGVGQTLNPEQIRIMAAQHQASAVAQQQQTLVQAQIKAQTGTLGQAQASNGSTSPATANTANEGSLAVKAATVQTLQASALQATSPAPTALGNQPANAIQMQQQALALQQQHLAQQQGALQTHHNALATHSALQGGTGGMASLGNGNMNALQPSTALQPLQANQAGLKALALPTAGLITSSSTGVDHTTHMATAQQHMQQTLNHMTAVGAGSDANSRLAFTTGHVFKSGSDEGGGNDGGSEGGGSGGGGGGSSGGDNGGSNNGGDDGSGSGSGSGSGAGGGTGSGSGGGSGGGNGDNENPDTSGGWSLGGMFSSIGDALSSLGGYVSDGLAALGDGLVALGETIAGWFGADEEQATTLTMEQMLAIAQGKQQMPQGLQPPKPAEETAGWLTVAKEVAKAVSKKGQKMLMMLQFKQQKMPNV